MVKEFEKKLSKDNLFLKLQHTRALIANNTLENKPSIFINVIRFEFEIH
jgi:dual specificity tyrosine-phosphorylation-regulated kinase 2/3/4